MTIIGVTGPKGRLGSALVEKYGCTPLNCNLLDVGQLSYELHRVNPDVVIHTAAKTDVDYCENNFDTILPHSLRATGNLCKAFQKRIIYISTDYVFDGMTGPYTERADPKPINYYGLAKLSGEMVLDALGSADCITVRTTILYGNPIKSDFAYQVVDQLRNKGSIDVPELYGNPTNVYHLAEALIWLTNLRRKLPIINVSGTTYLSRVDFANMIAEEFGLSGVAVQSVYHGTTPRPIHAGFDLTLARKIGIPLYSAIDGIRLFKEMLK